MFWLGGKTALEFPGWLGFLPPFPYFLSLFPLSLSSLVASSQCTSHAAHVTCDLPVVPRIVLINVQATHLGGS